jgi:hypothetical protein
MSHLRVSVFSLLILMYSACSAAAQGGTSADRDRATFVLGGKVQKVEVLKGVKIATLRVTASQRTPATIGSLADQDVRVITKDNSLALHPGSSYTFYAVGASGTDKVTVRELARIEGVSSNFQFTALQPSIAARYLNADVVVRAQVTIQTAAPSLLGDSEPDEGPPSEHDPKYQTWTLKIDDVLKGKVTGKSVDVLVATNPDIAYAGTGDAPAPTTPGETRVIALRWDPRVKSYVATDQVDVRPLSELPAIQMTVTPELAKKPHK